MDDVGQWRDAVARLISDGEVTVSPPVCPEHGGPMRALDVPNPRCGVTCACIPARYRCPGFDGEGCDHTVLFLEHARDQLTARVDGVPLALDVEGGPRA